MRTGALLEVRVMTGTGAGAAERVSGIDMGLDIAGALLDDNVCRNKLEEGPLVEEEEDDDVLKLSRSEVAAAGFLFGEISETEARSFPNRVRFLTGGTTVINDKQTIRNT